MTLNPLLTLAVALVAAASVVVFFCGIYLVRAEQAVSAEFASSNVRQGRRAKAQDVKTGPLTRLVDVAGRPLAPTVLRLMGENRVGKLRKRINAAGRPNGMTVDVYATRKAGFFVLFGVVGLFVFLQGSAFFGLLLLVIGFFWADALLISQSRARQYQIERTLPDFLDVLTVTVSAGLDFRNALDRVCDSMPGPLADEFRTALRQMQVGTSRREAFEELRNRNSCESLSQFVTALLQAEELGAPLSDALVEIGADMRREAGQAARRKAARTTPRVSLILTTVMVPAVLILLAGAMFISQRESFGGGLF